LYLTNIKKVAMYEYKKENIFNFKIKIKTNI
jgi:hypothetical protein